MVNNNNNNNNNSINKNVFSSLLKVPSLIEPFDGVRKNNARKIFGILLIIIVLDCTMTLVYN
jgi:hypothetical protein